MRPLNERQDALGRLQEAAVPKAENEPRGEYRLPALVRLNAVLHEAEKPFRLVVDLHNTGTSDS
jgi:hypothetical protein